MLSISYTQVPLYSISFCRSIVSPVVDILLRLDKSIEILKLELTFWRSLYYPSSFCMLVEQLIGLLILLETVHKLKEVFSFLLPLFRVNIGKLRWPTLIKFLL